MLRRYFPRVWLQWRLWRLNACPEARRWALGLTIEEAWETCPSEQWLRFWLRNQVHVSGDVLTDLNWHVVKTWVGVDYTNLNQVICDRIRQQFTADGSR